MIPIKDNIPADRFPFVTVGLILVNFVAYILAIRHGGSFISGPDTYEVVRYGAIPKAVTHCLTHDLVIHGQSIVCARSGGMPTWQTVFTAMFMHASILHIGGNMLFLWIFGNNVEDAMGPVKYFLFYIVGGLAALALQVAIGPNSAVPTLGASGAIAAVLSGYIVLYPRARVLTLVIIIFFFTVIELPAWIMLGIWFIQQAVFAAANLTTPAGGGGGVAYFAHIGGFVFGLLTVRLLATKRNRFLGEIRCTERVRYLVFAAALLFVGGFGLLTALYFADNGVTLVGIIGLIVLVICGVGIIGSLLHPPRR